MAEPIPPASSITTSVGPASALWDSITIFFGQMWPMMVFIVSSAALDALNLAYGFLQRQVPVWQLSLVCGALYTVGCFYVFHKERLRSLSIEAQKNRELARQDAQLAELTMRICELESPPIRLRVEKIKAFPRTLESKYHNLETAVWGWTIEVTLYIVPLVGRPLTLDHLSGGELVSPDAGRHASVSFNFREYFCDNQRVGAPITFDKPMLIAGLSTTFQRAWVDPTPETLTARLLLRDARSQWACERDIELHFDARKDVWEFKGEPTPPS
jgi:hypothetical protein